MRLPMAIDLLALVTVYGLWLFPKWNACGKRLLLANSLMYFYLCGVLYVTLMPVLTALPFLFDHPYIPMDLIAFDDLIHGWGDALRQVLLNITMTVPFGFLLPVCRRFRGKHCPIWYCLLCTIGLSLGIELLQPLLHDWRAADITDVITNTFGGLLGYLIYLLVQCIVLHFNKKSKTQ